MSKQVQEAYIVAATRTPIGRSHRGYFRNTRPDDLLTTALRAALAQVPGLDPASIEDVICGCAIPEGAQGLNVARIGAVLETLNALLARGLPLERVLPAFTSNVADLLRLPGKGRIRAGMDADLLALDANGAAGHVWLGGIAHLRAGEVVRRGMFER